MIKSFGSKVTEDLFHGRITGRLRRIAPEVQRAAVRKLDMINSARDVTDLKSPPGNRLEPLRGDLEGYYSIRVNDQWRIVFSWSTGGPSDVKLVDYH